MDIVCWWHVLTCSNEERLGKFVNLDDCFQCDWLFGWRRGGKEKWVVAMLVVVGWTGINNCRGCEKLARPSYDVQIEKHPDGL